MKPRAFALYINFCNLLLFSYMYIRKEMCVSEKKGERKKRQRCWAHSCEAGVSLRLAWSRGVELAWTRRAWMEVMREDGVDINLSPAVGPPPSDHTEGWNAWRIPPMVWPRQNTYCAGRSWMAWVATPTGRDRDVRAATKCGGDLVRMTCDGRPGLSEYTGCESN